jgi:DNA polymerase-3 subunit epsilon
MRILITDTETSGVSWDQGARVIEVAAMLYDTKHTSAIESFACLIKHHENPAEHVNGIPLGLLDEQGGDAAAVWEGFCEFLVQAECVVAHKAEFDQTFVTKSIEATMSDACDISELGEFWNPQKPWVCSISDIQWPGARESRSLPALALSLGLGVSNAHRAAADVDLLARCLTRANEVMRFEWLRTKVGECPEFGDFLEPMIRRGMRPKKRYVAKLPFDMNPILKQNGFGWDEPRRQWARKMSPEDVSGLPFHVTEVP